MDWSCLNWQQNHIRIWLGHSFYTCSYFVSCYILWWKEQEHMPLRNLTPLHSKIFLTGLIIITGLASISQTHHSLTFDCHNFVLLYFMIKLQNSAPRLHSIEYTVPFLFQLQLTTELDSLMQKHWPCVKAQKHNYSEQQYTVMFLSFWADRVWQTV